VKAQRRESGIIHGADCSATVAERLPSVFGI
jgi:hypothetical protein